MHRYVIYFLAVLYILPALVNGQGDEGDADAEGEGEGEGEIEVEIVCDEMFTECCEKLGKEAYRSCMSFSVVATTLNCRTWKETAIEFCNLACGAEDLCATTSGEMMNLCRGMLREDLQPERLEAKCSEMTDNFRDVRCAYTCEFDVNTCSSPEAKECLHCGNYQNCYCYTPSGDAQITHCSGTSYLEEERGPAFGCRYTPEECGSHKPAAVNRCAPYRWCPPDFCHIKEVTCNTAGPCERMSTCISETAQCKPIYYVDGTSCVTGNYYTIGGTAQCTGGECVGESDLCCKRGVTCATSNVCISRRCDISARSCTCSSCSIPSKPGYECDPMCDSETGMCLFLPEPNGSPCDSGVSWVTNERCFDGVCRGKEVDMCEDNNVECVMPPQCHRDGECDPHSGECVYVVADDGTWCDDQSDTTFGDICVEGTCRSSFYNVTAYNLVGVGMCTDAKKRSTTTFFHEGLRENRCREECTMDVTCEAYAFSIFSHMCMLFSRLRTTVPKKSGMRWILIKVGDPDVDTITSVMPTLLGGPLVHCYSKTAEGQGDIPSTDWVGRKAFWFLFAAFTLGLFLALLYSNFSTVVAGIKYYADLDAELDRIQRSHAWQKHLMERQNSKEAFSFSSWPGLKMPQMPTKIAAITQGDEVGDALAIEDEENSNNNNNDADEKPYVTTGGADLEVKEL